MSSLGALLLGYPLVGKKRVFISFRAEDQKRVDGLRLLSANPRFEIEFYDELVQKAIDSSDATYIRRRIRDKINRTSVTLCLVSELTHTSRWVGWELEESIDKGNTIICMGLPDGPDRLTLPEPCRRLKFGWWRWDLDKLKRLIDEAP